MPYKRVENLPDSVRHYLPESAQRIFVAAFDQTCENCEGEVRAFEVAWTRVKQNYQKDAEGNWHRRFD